MMHAQSNGSNASPGTVSSTACYDPLSKCIKLPSSTSDCGAILEGSILEIETPPFQPGKLLLGEIIEIVILDENMTPIAVFDESTSGPSGAAAAVMPASDQLSREELLEKQREQQQVQFQQSQELMQRHQEERQTLDEYERQGRLSPRSKVELAEEMEDTRNNELRELQVSAPCTEINHPSSVMNYEFSHLVWFFISRICSKENRLKWWTWYFRVLLLP